jgi:hypothetical protein
VELSPDTLRALEFLAKIKHDPLCPSCGHRRVDPKSSNGWCVGCDAKRERTLESKRKWWHANRGAGVDDRQRSEVLPDAELESPPEG